MLLVNLTIESACGLTLAADSSESSIITTVINQRPKGKNMIFAFSNDKNKDTLKHDLSKDFTDFHISKFDRTIVIYGEKRSHGMVSAIVNGNGFLMMPVIARAGTENFRYVLHDIQDLNTIERNVLKAGNKIETMTYDKIDTNDFIINSFNMGHYYPLLNITPTEWKILRTAYSRGYYSWPRVSQLGEISGAIGVSKTSVLYHLRNGERKILRKILGN